MMRIMIWRQGRFMVNMVWRVGIGFCLRMVFMIFFFSCFVRTRHNVTDYPLKFNYISTSCKKCR